MALYDFIKDTIGLAQKADNIELYKKLLDIGQMALDLQNENAELRRTVQELQAEHNIERDIESHSEPYFTLRSDTSLDSQRYFCTTCWAKDKKKIQMWFDGESQLQCPSCNVRFSMIPKPHKQRVSY